MNHISDIKRKAAAPIAAETEEKYFPEAPPEILAPAGTFEMMKAAVENGADAVYFGLEAFNARLRAHNFTLQELPKTMEYLHERGVKGYITLNTLIFSAELEEAAEVLKRCSEAGVDAVLVQDLGIGILAKRLVPDLPIHASTQMTLTSSESIDGAKKLGLELERVVAARESNVRELAKMKRGTDKEIEVFVHGAICVAYSGQCLTSEALGGRSANRGECAQACRLPYDLYVDGTQKDLGDVRYLLSPKDLAAYEDVGNLIEAGIVSLKIEGRLKSPEYVAATVSSYRKAVDEYFASHGGRKPRMTQDIRNKLEMTFSRGLTGGYVHETNHQAVVEGRFPKKRGLYLGRVEAVSEKGITAILEAPVKPGDGVVFDSGRPDRDEQGGRIYEVNMFGKSKSDPTPFAPRETVLGFKRGSLQLNRIRKGDRLWKTSDPVLDKELKESFAGENIRYRRPIDIYVEGKAGEPLHLLVSDSTGIQVELWDDAPAETAEKRPLTEEVLAEQLGRLGGTPFRLENLSASLDGELMVPMSRLNALRRNMVDVLLEKRRTRFRYRQTHPEALSELRDRIPPRTAAPSLSDSRLSVLCRTLAQVEAAVSHGGVETIYTDFEDIRLHKEARKLIPKDGFRFIPATLRVIKPGEAPFARKLLEANPDAILVRNLAAWDVLQKNAPHLPMIADYSMNVANELTCYLLKENGFEALVPSYDLNIDQLTDMLRRTPADWFEVTIHQHLPMFHMEHCVFCRFLSEGTDFTNCGRPCESHEIHLKDRLGYSHPVKADAGCRNTVFNAIPQSGSEYLGRLLDCGIRKFRVEFIDQDPEYVHQVINAYLPAVKGEIDGRKLWRDLRASSKLGVTRGSLDHD